MRRDRMSPWSLLGVGLLPPLRVLLSRRVSSGVHLAAPGGVVALRDVQDVLDTARCRRPGLRPRRPVHVRAGSPVDLSRWAGRGPTAEPLREVTEQRRTA